MAAVRDVLREDRDGNGVPDAFERRRPDPRGIPAQQAPSAPARHRPDRMVLVGLGAMFAVMLVAGLVVLLTRRDAYVPVPATAATPTTRAPRATTSNEPVPVESLPSASASASARAASPPKKKLTNEQYGQNVVAAQRTKLLGCMEQDLLYDPNVPKAYTVTVYVEADGAPKNSSTTFSPTPSHGFERCARLVIFYGFNDMPTGSPEKGPYTFSTSFAFPNAKPAAKKEHGRGWDD